MLWLRNLIYWLGLIALTPFFFVFLLLGFFFGRQAPHKVATSWALFLVWMLEHIVGLKYRVEGTENIPNQPSIICAKHQSGWETLALQAIFPPQVFVAKRELFKIPFFGWGLKLIRAIGIDRSNPTAASQQIIDQGYERKKDGLWITIFPEGTRIKPGQRGRYKQGAARMAKLLNMDLVPVALNSGEFWPKNAFLKYPGTITVVIGPPIAHDSGEADALMQQCETWIEGQQARINGAGPFAARPSAPANEHEAA